MKVNQIYNLLNSVSEQAFGNDGIQATDLTGLISMGDYVLNSSNTNSKDAFFNALVDRIGRTIVRRLDLDVRFKNIMTDSFEFGAVLQKITVSPLEAKISEPWKIGDNSYTPNQFAITKADVSQSLFSGVNTWSVKVTIPDNILKSAFTSESNMGAFIDGIISAMKDSMTLQINETNRLAVVNFIGEKINSDKNVIHLLTEYNAFSGKSETATTALASPDFYRFVAKRWGDVLGYLENPTTLFNEKGQVRSTMRDNAHIFMLGEFVNNFNVYLQSDVWHNEITKLPLFERVDFWQSPNTLADTMPDLASASAINITTSSGDVVNSLYIIGAIADRQAIGTTAYNVRTTTDRNNDAEYTNYSTKCDIGYFNDMSENGVVFSID